MRTTDERRTHSRGPWRGSVLFVTAGILALLLALALGSCGGKQETTTSSSSVSPTTQTTAAGLPGSLTTASTDAMGGETTTSVTEASTEDTTTTTLAAEGETTTTEQLSSAEQRLADGHIKAMGYIKKVWEQGGKRYISIDYAELLTGDAAIDAAVAAGEIQAGEDLPNDYFIKNSSSEKRQFEVSASAAFTTSSWQGKMDNPITWSVFKSLWSASPPDQEAALLRDSPWWIERDGKSVVKIDEQYLP